MYTNTENQLARNMSTLLLGEDDDFLAWEALRCHSRRVDAGEFDHTIYEPPLQNQWLQEQESTRAIDRDDTYYWKRLGKPLSRAELARNGKVSIKHFLQLTEFMTSSYTRHSYSEQPSKADI